MTVSQSILAGSAIIAAAIVIAATQLRPPEWQISTLPSAVARLNTKTGALDLCAPNAGEVALALFTSMQHSGLKFSEQELDAVTRDMEKAVRTDAFA